MYYHIWFVTKYRKMVLEGDIEKMVRDVFTECISRHKYNILEFETNKDHMHMLAEAKNKEEIASMVRTLKAVSAKEILQAAACSQGAEAFREKRAFWARRYGWREVAQKDLEAIRKYIQDQKILHTVVCRDVGTPRFRVGN